MADRLPAGLSAGRVRHGLSGGDRWSFSILLSRFSYKNFTLADDGETCPGFIYDNILREWEEYAEREASGMTIPVSAIRQMNQKEMLAQRKSKKYNRAKKTPKK